MTLRIDVKLLNENAKIPKRAHDRDAGFDMVATSKKVTDKYIEYGTGVSMNIPEGYVGLIYPRSSITKKDLILKNSVGVIDSGYLGEISFRFYKNIVEEKIIYGEEYDYHSDKMVIFEGKSIKYRESEDVYEVGDRIGQIIFQTLPDIILIETDELDNFERGDGSYGSTDILQPPEPPKCRILKKGKLPEPPKE